MAPTTTHAESTEASDPTDPVRDRIRAAAQTEYSRMADELRDRLESAERLGTYYLGTTVDERVVIWHTEATDVVSISWDDGTYSVVDRSYLDDVGMWAANHTSLEAATDAGIEGVA